MVLPDGTIIAQDYDGLAGARSDAARLFCDPDKVLMVVDEDGVESLPLNERGVPTEIYPGRSKTVQASLDETDINKIVKRMEQGVVPLLNREGAFLDVSEVPDFRGALEQVIKAREYFETLPAQSRAMFQNDPAVFLDAVKDDTQFEKLVEAGVIPKDEVRVPVEGGAVVPPEAAP